ncbi:N-acyl homoserine lactonase family protein [Chloroflexota bacterium]
MVMANCVIRPIPLVELKLEKSMITYGLNFGQLVTLIGYSWYIEGTGKKILIDAGGGVEYMSGRRGVPARDIQTLEAGLGKLGISADDIDIVIITHLHFDHVAQAHRFPRAKILIQRDELEFANNPHPVAATAYPKEFFEGLDFEVISGDTKICEEVSVLSTPGHSPGGQSVSVKTAQGTAIIAGMCTIRENFEPPSTIKETVPVIAPGIHVNPLDAYDSLLKIKDMADIVVPLHDPEFQHKSSIP